MWYTGYFFLFMLVSTAVCFSVMWARSGRFDSNSFVTISILGVMTMAGWLPAFWASPVHMAVFHSCLVTMMAFTFPDDEGLTLMYGCTVMLLADISYIFIPVLFTSSNTWGFPGHLFWWQSPSNLILLFLYADTLKKCYVNSRQLKGYPGAKSGDADLYSIWSAGEQRLSR